MRDSNYEAEFEKILAREYFSSNFDPIRKNAFKQFLDNGISKKYWENLRFTNISALKKNLFAYLKPLILHQKSLNILSQSLKKNIKLFFIMVTIKGI